MKLHFLNFVLWGACISGLSINFGCTPQSDSNLSSKSPEEVALIKRGKAVYQAGCIACHNSNPAVDGPLGPLVKGASLELLEARILRAEYPQGYQPKRTTKLMIALPQYKSDIPALYQYLQNP